jgi:hypothetical protein
MDSVLISVGLLGVVVYLWSTIRIYAFLQARQEPVQSFLLINFHIFSYLKRYKALTAGENGKAGSLYYIWLGSINLALVCALLLIILNALS